MDDNDLIEQIEDLSHLSKKKKFRLNKQEESKSLEVLIAYINNSKEHLELMLPLLPTFPYLIGSEVLFKKWSLAKELEVSISKKFQSKDYSSIQGVKLRLSIISRLVQDSPREAQTLLIELCQDFKASSENIPKATYLRLLYNILLELELHQLKSLPLSIGMKNHVQPVIISILAAAFMGRDNGGNFLCVPSKQIEFIRWFRDYEYFPDLPKELDQVIEKTVTNWDASMKSTVEIELETLAHPLRNPIRRAIGKSESHNELLKGPKLQEDHKDENPQIRDKYDPVIAAGRLLKYVQETKREVTSLNNQCNIMRVEKKKLHDNLDVSNAKLKKLEIDYRKNIDELDKLKCNMKVLKEERDALKTEVEDATQQLELTRNDHQNANDAHEQHLDVLSDRIANEGSLQVDAFKRNLESRLTLFARTIKECEDMEMNVELGTSMKILVTQIMKTLNSEGINLSSGS